MREWRKIPFLRFYSVSSDGLIRFDGNSFYVIDAVGREYIKVLPPQLVSTKSKAAGRYHKFRASDNGVAQTVYVHHAVAAAFLGSRPEGTQVRHIDGNASNNAASNLAYGSPRENAQDKHRHGTHRAGSDCAQAKLTERLVVAVRAFARDPRMSNAYLAGLYGVSSQTMDRAVSGKTWRHA
jgi:hypothetical protein